MSGTTVTVYQNGTQIYTGTITNFSTQTKHGLNMGTNSTAVRWDDWSATYTIPPTALTGSIDAGLTLASYIGGYYGSYTSGYSGPAPTALTGGADSEQILAGHLTVIEPFTGSITVEHVLAAALTVSEPIASWSTDDVERTDLPLELFGILDVIPVEDPPPATDPYIQQVSVTMPVPTLVNGRPSGWTGTIARSDWGRLQLIVGGVDLSRPRGKPFLPLTDNHTDPFGDADASFAFPGLSEFDDPDTWGLTALAPVTLRRKDPGGVFHTLYEGDLASLEPDAGMGLVVHCVGAGYRLDLLKEPPPLLIRSRDCGDLIALTINDKIRRYLVNLNYTRHVHTGVSSVANGTFQDVLTGSVQDYLAELQTQGSETTVMLSRPRTLVIQTRDTTTVHATVSYGGPGVDMAAPKDFTTAITGVYGTGSNGHCQWMGARFPNLHQESTPSFPLAVGAVFNPGSATTGFAPFAAYLRSGQYGTIESDDTYLASDEDSVKQFQDRAGITVDGIVGAQTWEAAFQPGANQGSLYGAYVDTIYERPETRRRLYNAQGADVGPNPALNPSVPRIEEYVPFGDNVSKKLGRTSAKQIIARSHPADRLGDLTLTADPPGMSRWDLQAGMNIQVDNFAGTSVLVHISQRTRDWQAGAVHLTVDAKSRDLLTAAAIYQRSRDVSDLTRRQKFGRVRSRVFNDYGTWLCEDGAGEIPVMNQQAGFWNVQRIAAAPKGRIERISLAMGSGLTQHVLNEAIAHTIASIPGAARGAMLIFDSPVTANNITALTGMGTPVTALSDGTNPVDHNQDPLNALGLIYAAGGPGAQIGFYPNNDPGDGSSTNLTGMFEDGGSIDFGPTGHTWLWVAIWTSTSCKVGGRIFPGPPG
jgi:peptidoglycan hydrolase-like protein with peptidoglycan-binding domain